LQHYRRADVVIGASTVTELAAIRAMLPPLPALVAPVVVMLRIGYCHRRLRDSSLSACSPCLQLHLAVRVVARVEAADLIRSGQRDS
jgi:hypothetical protein